MFRLFGILIFPVLLNSCLTPHKQTFSQTETETEVGQLKATFSVNQDGVATYTVPLQVPPGTSNMQPQLSLLYSHRNESGITGIGWTIEGTSVIERCGASIEQDGFHCGVNYNSQDRFCLDGQRLVNIVNPNVTSSCFNESDDESYYQDEAIYHTEVESWRQVQSINNIDETNCENGPCGFIITDKKGWKWEYGSPYDDSDPYGSRIYASNSPDSVRSWLLNHVEDRHGNAIDFYYTQSPLGDQSSSNDQYYPCSTTSDGYGNPSSPDYTITETEDYYPCRIDYTSNQDTSPPLSAQRHILFAYQQRPENDFYIDYTAGSIVERQARLTDATTFVDTDTSSGDGDLVLNYQICYDDDGCYESNPSRLTSNSRIGSVSECASDDTCLPATVFTYGPDLPADFDSVFEDAETNYCSNPVSWADFDGDGRIDWICNLDQGVTVNLAADDFDLSKTLELSPENMTCNNGTPEWSDFNGDGLDDWLCFSTISATSGSVTVYLSDGLNLNLLDTTISTNCSAYSEWIDFNADGQADWVCSDESVTYILLSSEEDIQNPFLLTLDGESIGCDYTIEWIDFNGDQMVDWVCTNTNTGGMWVLLSTGNELADSTSYSESDLINNGPALCPSNTTHSWADFNGDSLNDFICSGLTSGGAIVQISLSNGLALNDPENTWTATLDSGCYTDVNAQLLWTDVNGDSMHDLTCNLYAGSVSVARSTGNDLLNLIDQSGDSMNCSDSSQVLSWFDYTGDGLSDWICTSYGSINNVSIYTLSSGFPDLMESITNGFNGTTNIEYLPLSNEDVYSSGTSSNPDVRRMLNSQANHAYPAQASESSLYLVSSYSISDGIDSVYNYNYFYSSGLVDFSGRGWLGFQTVTVEDPQQGNQTITAFNQNFPFNTSVSSTKLTCLSGSTVDPNCNGGDVLLHETTYDYYCLDCQISSECWLDDNLEQSDGVYSTSNPTFEPFACTYQVLRSSRQVDFYTYGSYDFSLGKTYEYDNNGTDQTNILLPNNDTQIVGLGNLTQQVDLNKFDKSEGDNLTSDNVYTGLDYFNDTDQQWLIGFVTQHIVSSDENQNDILKQKITAYDYPDGQQNQDSCSPSDWNYKGTMDIICHKTLAIYQSFENNVCTSSSKDPIWLENFLTYDDFGNVITITNANGNTTNIAYETTYNTFPNQLILPNGLSSSYEFDPKFGKKISLLDFNNSEFSTDYDLFGRRSHDYGPNDGSQSTNPFTLATYSWRSENSNNQTQFYLEVEQSTDWEDSSQTLWSRSYYDGLARTYMNLQEGIDDNSNILKQRKFVTPDLVSIETQPIFCSDTSCTSEEFDTNSCGSSDYPYISNTLDAYGRVLSKQIPFGIDSDFQCTLNQWKYPDSLSTTQTTAVNSSVQTFQDFSYDYYDSIRRNVTSATPFQNEVSTCNSSNSSYEEDCSITDFEYDILGRLLTTTDPNGIQTSYCYDSLDRPQSNFISEAFSYSYQWDGDSSETYGLMVQRTDSQNQSLSYEYDSLNRIETKTVKDENQNVTSQVLYSWDSDEENDSDNANGLLTSIQVNNATESLIDYSGFQYSDYGHRISGSVSLGAVLTPDNQSRDYSFSASWDPLGRPIIKNFPDGSAVQYCYNNSGSISQLSMYETSPSVTCIDDLDGSEIASINYTDYNSFNQPLNFNYGNGIEAIYSYDTRAQMLTQELSSGETQLLNNAFSWDQLSQVYGITDQLYTNGISTKDSSQQFSLTNQRLTSASSDPYGLISYAYDQGGRITSVDDSNSNKIYYLYGQDSEGLSLQCGVITSTEPNQCPTMDDPSVVYWGNYNFNGNLTDVADSETQWSYSYDPENRLTGVVSTISNGDSTTSTLTSQYSYNHLDQRIQKQDSWDNTTIYVTSNYEVTFESEGDGTYKTQYTKYLQSYNSTQAAITNDGDGTTDQPVINNKFESESDSNSGIPIQGTYYYNQDHLGSTNLVTASDGSVFSKAAYKPYGLISIDPEDSDTYRKKFNGKEFDEDTSLYYFSSRYYDPVRGRFLTADTHLGGPSATTQDAWNRYSFALNNPVTHSDPSGHSVGSWFKHLKKNIKKFVKNNWKQILIGIAIDAAMPEFAPEADAALAGELALESTSEALEGGASIEADITESSIDSQTAQSCSGSFVSGTLVSTENGIKNIEDVALGERVISFSHGNNKIQHHKVVQAKNRIIDRLIKIKLGHEVIHVTEEHPFWLNGKGWVKASDLNVGDKLKSINHIPTSIDKIESINGYFQVFNFLIEGTQNYFVSNGQYLVHNTCWGNTRHNNMNFSSGNKYTSLEDFWNNSTQQDFDEAWTDSKVRKSIKSALRRESSGGGEHEWMMVSRAPQFKKWGVTLDQFQFWQESTENVTFIDTETGSIGAHTGSSESTYGHNALGNITDDANSYTEWKKNVVSWAKGQSDWRYEPQSSYFYNKSQPFYQNGLTN